MATKTLTNLEIINALNALGKLNDEYNFSTKVSFRLAAWSSTLSSAVEVYNNKRQELIDEYTERDDEGNPIHPKDKETGEPDEERIQLTDSEEFNEKMTELTNEEIEVQLMTTLSYEDFDNEKAEIEDFALLAPLTPLIEGE